MRYTRTVCHKVRMQLRIGLRTNIADDKTPVVLSLRMRTDCRKAARAVHNQRVFPRPRTLRCPPIRIVQRIGRCKNEPLRHTQKCRRNIGIPCAGHMRPDRQMRFDLWKIREKCRHARMMPPLDLYEVGRTNRLTNFAITCTADNLHTVRTANIDEIHLLRLLKQQNPMPPPCPRPRRICGDTRESLAHTAAHMGCNMQYFAHAKLLYPNGLTKSASAGNFWSRSERIGAPTSHGIPTESQRIPASQSGS